MTQRTDWGVWNIKIMEIKTMKYIPAEKLITEIERQYRSIENATGDYAEGRRTELENFSRFIASLQQEQPKINLKKEVKSYIKDNFTITDEVAQIPEEDRRYSMWEDDMRAFARHFWNKGYNARKEQPSLPSSLDEAAEEYAYNNWEDNDYHTGASEGLPFDAIGHTEKCFKAGAEWMAGQGVSVDALAGYCMGDVLCPDFELEEMSAKLKHAGFQPGDKVVVQIRKK